MKGNPSCPHCRKENPTFGQLNKFEKDFLSSIKFQGCPNAGCDLLKNVTMKEVMAHLNSNECLQR